MADHPRNKRRASRSVDRRWPGMSLAMGPHEERQFALPNARASPVFTVAAKLPSRVEESYGLASASCGSHRGSGRLERFLGHAAPSLDLGRDAGSEAAHSRDPSVSRFGHARHRRRFGQVVRRITSRLERHSTDFAWGACLRRRLGSLRNWDSRSVYKASLRPDDPSPAATALGPGGRASLLSIICEPSFVRLPLALGCAVKR